MNSKVPVRYRGSDSLFGSFFDDIFNGTSTFDRPFYIGRQVEDVQDIDGGKRLLIPVPGRTKENIEITVEGDDLKISAKSEESKFGKLFRSFSTSEFATIYNIPEFDKESIEASVTDGILTIDLKYKSTSKGPTVKIPVK